MIQVITHNGKSPALGGLRLGYRFTNALGGIEMVPASLAIIFTPPPPPCPAETPAIKVIRNWFGKAACPCGRIHGTAMRPAPLGFTKCISCGRQLEVRDE